MPPTTREKTKKKTSTGVSKSKVSKTHTPKSTKTNEQNLETLFKLIPTLEKIVENYSKKDGDIDNVSEDDDGQNLEQIRNHMDTKEHETTDGEDSDGDPGECKIIETENFLFTSAGVALDAHLSSKLKAKIVSGEFVEYKQLLPNINANKKKNIQLGDAAQKITLSFGEDDSSDILYKDWHKAHLIYSTVMIKHKKDFDLAVSLLKYTATITRMAEQGGDWYGYDKQFRMQNAGKPKAPWHQPNWELWQYSLTSKKPTPSTSSNNNNARSKKPPRSNVDQGAKGPGTGRGTCHAFNNTGNCRFGQGCRFRHVCGKCSGSHPGLKCNDPDKNAHRSGGGKQNSAGLVPQ